MGLQRKLVDLDDEYTKRENEETTKLGAKVLIPQTLLLGLTFKVNEIEASFAESLSVMYHRYNKALTRRHGYANVDPAFQYDSVFPPR
mgnify:CR=1 FL=1